MGECVGCGRRFILVAPRVVPGYRQEDTRPPWVPPHDRATGSREQISEQCGGSGLLPAG